MSAWLHIGTKTAAGLVGLLLGACATSHQQEEVNAMGDFVAVNELAEADSITSFKSLEQDVLNDWYVIVDNGSELFLIEYAYRCVEDPLTRHMRPDVRRDGRKIYARTDTFRGCQIKAIYPITGEQAQELRELGEAPGQRN